MELVLSDFHLSKNEKYYILFLQNKFLDFNTQLKLDVYKTTFSQLIELKNKPQVIDVEYDDKFWITSFKVLSEKALGSFFHKAVFDGYSVNPDISLKENIEKYRQYLELDSNSFLLP